MSDMECPCCGGTAFDGEVVDGQESLCGCPVWASVDAIGADVLGPQEACQVCFDRQLKAANERIAKLEQQLHVANCRYHSDVDSAIAGELKAMKRVRELETELTQAKRYGLAGLGELSRAVEWAHRWKRLAKRRDAQLMWMAKKAAEYAGRTGAAEVERAELVKEAHDYIVAYGSLRSRVRELANHPDCPESVAKLAREALG